MNVNASQSLAQTLLRKSLVCDLTLPWLPDCEPKEETLNRFRESGFDFVSLTVGADRTGPLDTARYIAAEVARFKQRDDIVIVGKVGDIKRAKAEGKLAIGFHFQGTNPLAGDIDMVELFYQLGVRHMLLAYNLRNVFADGCHERTDAGLSRRGVKLIRRMNAVGMLIDCSHTGYRSSLDIMEVSSQPVIFSHTNISTIKYHPRNIRDDQIKACARSGGLVGLTGVGFFLNEENAASVESMIEHIAYISDLVGPQYVGLGLDFIYYEEVMYARYRANPDIFPDGYPPPPWQCLPPEQLGNLVEKLLERGYSEDHILGMLGDNFLRVAEQVWK